ncbi:VOC family protein [Diaphorobacter sp.]|uniref:VOC family protein n=1 Tax=Diaphorobacter sp. TaxID=1934310 RepID=UPI003D0C53A3
MPLSHVSLDTNRFSEAVAFYDAVLVALGIGRVHDWSEHQAVAYGRAFPEFWNQHPHDMQPAQTANGVHIAFLTDNNAQVDAFHQATLIHDGRCDGPPGPHPEHSDAYDGCFVHDLDGHKIEAMA